MQELATEHLSHVKSCLKASDARLVRAALAVLRAFAFCEDVRDLLSLSSETKSYLKAVKEHLDTAVVCEQAFGLLSNLALRTSHARGRGSRP